MGYNSATISGKFAHFITRKADETAGFLLETEKGVTVPVYTKGTLAKTVKSTCKRGKLLIVHGELDKVGNTLSVIGKSIETPRSQPLVVVDKNPRACYTKDR